MITKMNKSKMTVFPNKWRVVYNIIQKKSFLLFSESNLQLFSVKLINFTFKENLREVLTRV